MVESMLKGHGDSAGVFKYLETLLEADGGSDGEERKEACVRPSCNICENCPMDSKAAAALVYDASESTVCRWSNN